MQVVRRLFYQGMKDLKPTDRHRTVIVEGNIASGKSEFLKYFEKYSNVQTVYEPVDKWRDANGVNVFELMYKNPSRWSFTFQSYVQLTMMNAHTYSENLNAGDTKLMERSIFSAKYCFVENMYRNGYMEKVEYAVLTEWFDWILKNTRINVDLIVYLRTDPKVVYERLLKRRRAEENVVSLEYLVKLHNLYETWLREKHQFIPANVLEIDANADLPTMYEAYDQLADDILLPNYPESVRHLKQ